MDAVQHEGLQRWSRCWKDDGGDPKACDILVDAMARFTLHLKARGASPRVMSGVYSDLDIAGTLVMSYEAPKGRKVLQCFGNPVWECEFRSKVSDSPSALKRYRSTCEQFDRFLRDSGMLNGG